MNKVISKISIAFLLLISRLPIVIHYWFSNFLYILLFKIVEYRKKVVLKNIDLVYPSYSKSQKTELARNYFLYLSQLIVEVVKGFTISRKELQKRISVDNSYLYDELFNNNQSAIVALGHNGNWEWICRHASMVTKHKLYVAYKPLSNPFFDKLMAKTRTAFGMQQIAMNNVGRFIIEHKNEAFLLILISDQKPSNPKNGIWVDFFKTKTSFLPGLEKLSLKYNLPIYFHEVKRVKRGYYRCKIHHLLNPLDYQKEGSITQKYARHLEKMIVEQPETWLWSHNRFKHKFDI